MSRMTPATAAAIVRDAGGRVVGRTRLQKIAYLLSATGLQPDLAFSYKHYGPFSEDLATAVRDADLLGLVRETEHQASWGGTYSIYEVTGHIDGSSNEARTRLASEAAAADAIALELAATALLLAKEGIAHPWHETERRKPEKASNGGLVNAKKLYEKLTDIKVPTKWPKIGD